MGGTAKHGASVHVRVMTVDDIDGVLGACLSNPDVVPEQTRFSVSVSFGLTITRTGS